MNDEIINAILVTSAKPFAVFTLFRKNMENRDLIAKRMRVLVPFFSKIKKIRYAYKQRILICIIKPIGVLIMEQTL